MEKKLENEVETIAIGAIPGLKEVDVVWFPAFGRIAHFLS